MDGERALASSLTMRRCVAVLTVDGVDVWELGRGIPEEEDGREEDRPEGRRRCCRGVLRFGC